LWEFCRIYNLGVFGNRDKLSTLWCQKVSVTAKFYNILVIGLWNDHYRPLFCTALKSLTNYSDPMKSAIPQFCLAHLQALGPSAVTNFTLKINGAKFYANPWIVSLLRGDKPQNRLLSNFKKGGCSTGKDQTQMWNG